MSLFDRLSHRAARSRRADYAEPVVATPEEAVALAAEIADAFADLSGQDRLLFLSRLHDLQSALDGRERRLDAEMAQQRGALARLNKSVAATRGYLAAAAPAPRNGKG
jgi:hypothetical protein